MIYRMKHIYTRITLIIALTLSVVACRKDSPNIMNPEDVIDFSGIESYPSTIFQNFWNAMNTNYLFWDIEPTDWDKIYTEYAPKFEALDEIHINETYDDMYQIDNYVDGGETQIYVYPSAVQALDYYKEMTANLVDNHYYFELKGVGYTTPSYTQVTEREYYHAYDTEETTYICEAAQERDDIDKFKIAVYDNVSSTGFTIYSAEIGDGIALLSISKFYLYETVYFYSSLESSTEWGLYDVLDNYFEIIDSPNFKGVIMDFRNNTGGYNYDMNILFDSLISKDDYIEYAQARQKNGPGRLDYSPYLTLRFNGSSNEPTHSFPIVTLTNLYTVSMPEVACLFAKEFNSNSYWIGERTFGAQSSLIDDSVYAGGMIENDDMMIYTPSMMTSDINKVCHEGYGLEPDLEILYNDTIDDLRDNQIDRAMDAAVEYLNNL